VIAAVYLYMVPGKSFVISPVLRHKTILSVNRNGLGHTKAPSLAEPVGLQFSAIKVVLTGIILFDENLPAGEGGETIHIIYKTV